MKLLYYIYALYLLVYGLINIPNENCELWFLQFGLFLIPDICLIWFSVIGSILIVFGLYSVLWGKNREMNKKDATQETVAEEAIKDGEKDDMESQLYIPSD